MLDCAENRKARAFAAAALALAMCGCGQAARSVATAKPAPQPNVTRQIVADGRLQPYEGVIELSALPGERLESLSKGVEPGATFPAGSDLGHVGSYALRQAQLEAVDARLNLAVTQREHDAAVAQSQVNQAVAGVLQAQAKVGEVNAQVGKLDSLKEAADIAQTDAEILTKLRESDLELLTEQQARHKRNLALQVKQDYEAARLSQQAARAAADAAVNLANENLAFAKTSLERAKTLDPSEAIRKERKVAEAMLEQSVLRAPPSDIEGKTYTVLQVSTKPGGFVTQIPILQVGDLSRMVVVAEVYEADVKELEKDQPALIRSPAFAGEYSERSPTGPKGIKGKVAKIGTMVTSPALINRNPLGPGERSIVEVIVEIDPNDADAVKEAARRVGMQVKVDFLPSEKTPAGAAAKPSTAAAKTSPK